MTLDGKVVLITGATGASGPAIARVFAEEEPPVCLSGPSAVFRGILPGGVNCKVALPTERSPHPFAEGSG